jgi:hypothetical protein
MTAKWTHLLLSTAVSGLPDLLFEIHPCGLHICYPEKMGEFGFVQTIKDNMKIVIAGAVQAQDRYEKMIFPSTADFREIVRASNLGCDITPVDAKATGVIWGHSILKMKRNIVRRNVKCLVQSVINVPMELTSSNKMLG